MMETPYAEIEANEPDWKPLETVLSRRACEDFMYMGRCGDIHLYKHYFSRRYLNISSDGGRFYRYCGGRYIEVAREIALDNLRG